jgi:hypothetical protein
MALTLHALTNPRIDSREAFCVWMCEQHNMVNAKLRKPTFPCDMAKLDARWRDGGERCMDPPEMTSASTSTEDASSVASGP